uniref:Uncharacterized protein n=1 Tax=Chrysotila carterae TaxID=13221 RepID=A0A7S4BLU8_CHRCT
MSAGAVSMAPRGTRTRKISERMRVFDEDTRREITRRRLESLEKDNWQEERRKEEDEDEEEYVLSASSGDEVAVSAAKKQRRKKQKKRDAWNASQQCKTLQARLDTTRALKQQSTWNRKLHACSLGFRKSSTRRNTTSTLLGFPRTSRYACISASSQLRLCLMWSLMLSHYCQLVLRDAPSLLCVP